MSEATPGNQVLRSRIALTLMRATADGRLVAHDLVWKPVPTLGSKPEGKLFRDHAVMMKREAIPIAKIYVPAKRRGTLDPKKAQELAESILQNGQQVPILVRQDGSRFVLVEGLHRLEACKQLGEETIFGYLVQARRH